MTPILDCLPTLLGLNEEQDRAIEAVLKEPNVQNMAWLSLHMDIRIKFKYPVTIRIAGRPRHKETDCHVFRNLWNRDGTLCYSLNSNARRGYQVPGLIESWEPVTKTSDHFSSYGQFKKKFDLRFIKEDEIKKLWDGHSPQHDGKYRKSDFRKLSPTARGVMEDFLRFFKGINEGGGEGYHKSSFGNYQVLSKCYKSYGRQNSVFGRDITISHQTCSPYVHHASEYPGCGNGRYGLIANKNTYLWLEDD